MTLTTQHLEELLRLALTENERLADALQKEKDYRALEHEIDQSKRETGRLERKALVRDVSDASIRLFQAADLLRQRNGELHENALTSGEQLREWAKKLRVST